MSDKVPPISWEMFLKGLNTRYQGSNFKKLCSLYTTNIPEKIEFPYAVLTFQLNGVQHRTNRSIISNFDYSLAIFSTALKQVNELSEQFVSEFVNKLDYVFADTNVKMIGNLLRSNVPAEDKNIWRCDMVVSVQLQQPNYR